MHCREVNKNIYAFYDGTLAPNLYAKIALHLDECEPCRNHSRLIFMETEALKVTSDIPDLRPDFAAMVINSLGSAKKLSPKTGAVFLPRPWRGALAAAAAVIVLGLYLPPLFYPDNPVNLASKEDYISQPVLPTAGQDLSSPNLSPLRETNLPVTSAEPMTEPALLADEKELPPVPQTSAPVAPAETRLTAVQSAAPILDEQKVSIAGPSALLPQNLPTRFHLVAVDIINGNQTVYNYSGLDEREKLKVSVVPYRDKPLLILPLTRLFEVGDESIMVTYSGSLSSEELELLANSIMFSKTGR